MPENNKDIELDLSQFDLPTLRLIDKALRPSEFDLFWKNAKTGDEWCLGEHKFRNWNLSAKGLYLFCDDEIFLLDNNGKKRCIFRLPFRWNLDNDLWLLWDSDQSRSTSEGLYVRHEGEIYFLPNNGQKKFLGKYDFYGWEANSQGLYLRSHDNEFTFIDHNGEKKSLGKHKCNRWGAFSHGLFLYYEKKFFFLDHNGEKKSLGEHRFDLFRLCEAGLCLRLGNEFYFLDYNGENKYLGKHDWDGWEWCAQGLYLCHGRETFFINYDGETKLLGEYGGREIMGFRPSPYGLYIVRDNDVYLVVNKG